MSNVVDLNAMSIRTGAVDLVLSEERSALIEVSPVEKAVAVFQHLDSHLAGLIESWPVVVGCMAWLTHRRILGALASRPAASMLVQKEEFIRGSEGSGWLRSLYDAVPGVDAKAAGVHFAGEDPAPIEGVRCIGMWRPRDGITLPRMHHKFMVFCEDRRESGEGFYPAVVWTGSFNATENATHSLENALVVRDPNIAFAYFREWRLLQGVSEPLDWTSRDVSQRDWASKT